jgi:FG-GAP-like repeat/ASPIC and UnbV
MKKNGRIAIPIILLPLLLFSSLQAQMYKLQTQHTGLEFAVYGHGVAVADYNNDGLIDIYFVTHTPYNPSIAGSADLLLKNNGDGTFTDVAPQLGLAGKIDTTTIIENKTRLNYGAAWGDFDNDGDVDLYLTNKGIDALYENLGDGTFRDITRQAGLATNVRESTSAAWFDFDNDGDLDLYVSCYGKYGYYASSDNVLYRNEGNGTFVDVTANAGVGDSGFTYSTMVVDVNLDGWPDLYCVNDFGANHFYLNLGDGTFREATKECGLENDGHGMGVTLGDYDNNGLFDIYVTNIADEGLEWSPLFSQIRTGVFQDVTQQTGTGITNWAWGCEFLDFDLDGDLDLYVVNGFSGNAYYNRLYRNLGNGSFEDISAISGAGSEEEARGLSVADFNNDGRLDMVVANWRAPAELYMNSMTGGNYLKIELVGTKSNRDARGAIVSVEADNKTYFRPNDGVEFLGQSKTPLHFGLNHSTMAQRITVKWPSGLQQEFLNIPANQTITITEGSSVVTGVKQKAVSSQPQQFRLLANYPNPVREVTQLRFQTPTATDLSIDVYDLLGRKLATPLQGFFSAGIHTFNWQAQNQFGDPLPAGVYLIRLVSKEFVNQRKLVVIR